MGTNYYADAGPATGRLHIGKNSAGWRFSFHAIPEHGLTSWQAWRSFLAEVPIVDEYERPVLLGDLVGLIERKSSGPHAEPPYRCSSCPSDMGGPSLSDTHDPDRHPFYAGEFC